MPIFEYECRGCGQPFEYLILPQSPEAICPHCESRDVEKMLSVAAVSTEGTEALSRKSSNARHRKRRDEHARESHEYYHKHHDEP